MCRKQFNSEYIENIPANHRDAAEDATHNEALCLCLEKPHEEDTAARHHHTDHCNRTPQPGGVTLRVTQPGGSLSEYSG